MLPAWVTIFFFLLIIFWDCVLPIDWSPPVLEWLHRNRTCDQNDLEALQRSSGRLCVRWDASSFMVENFYFRVTEGSERIKKDVMDE